LKPFQAIFGEHWRDNAARLLGLKPGGKEPGAAESGATKPLGERPERRAQTRQKSSFSAILSSPNATIPVDGLNFHERGICVLSHQPLAPTSVIFIHIKGMGLLGFANVRHCTQHGRSFAIGLEFESEPMREEMGNWHFERISEAGQRIRAG
jgi:hypothetical protein